MLSFPNCKINLGLHVVSKRPDGYHNLETLFLPVPLTDKLEINISETNSFSQDGIPIAGNPNDNLCVKAYNLLRESYPEQVGSVTIHLKKNIPFGAGLGGGSADAAFTLKMLNELFSLQLSSDELRAFAARLGADCPFFIDNQPAYATGIGDLLEPFPINLSGYALLLVKPQDAVSTKEAYSGIVPRDKRTDINPVDLKAALCQPVDLWKEMVVNDFEDSVFPAHPAIAAIKQQLYDCGATYAAMSGSGSTVFGLFNCKNESSLTKAKSAFADTDYFIFFAQSADL